MITKPLFLLACFGFVGWTAASSADTLALVSANTGGLHFEGEKMEHTKLQQEQPFEAKKRKPEAGEERTSHGKSSEVSREGKKKSEGKLDFYVVEGVVKLLFDNTTENFKLFYDAKNKRSRVDYGTGKVRTIQLGGDLNKLYRIEFPTRELPTARTVCIEMRGTRDKPVHAQKAFPSLDKFERAGSEQIGSHRVDRWKCDKSSETNSMKHTFSLLVDPKNHKPVRLEVLARNGKTGLVTDRYEVEYKQVMLTRPTDDVFQVPVDVQCRSILGNLVETGEDLMSGFRRRIRDEPHKQHSEERQSDVQVEGGRKEKRPLVREDIDKERQFMNPIASLIDPDEHTRYQHEIQKLFELFQRRYKKKYDSENEVETRRATFCHNFRYINFMNRAGLSFRLRINHLADRTNDELRKMLGFKRTKLQSTHAESFDEEKHNIRGIKKIPDTVDWRLLGAVCPVTDQGSCGSDWAIAATCVTESAIFLRTNRRFKLSTQELLDCSQDEGNHGCEGGEDFRAFDYIIKNGLSSEMTYGPLLNRKDQCRKETPVSAKIKRWIRVSPNDEFELKRAVAMNGPVAVAIDASHKSFFFYASGIYHEPHCRSASDEVNHAVVVVGYGQLNSRDYLLVQNSFSTEWGLNGVMLFESAANHCGILTSPTFVANE